MHAANTAFTGGLNVTGAIAVVIFGALAVLIARVRRASETTDVSVDAGVPEPLRAGV